MNKWSALGLLVLAAAVYGESLVVDTNSGRVRGKPVHDEVRETSYYAFSCIPYAEAPVGKLRFQPPQAVKKWDNILAEDKCDMCPQIDFMAHEYLGSEDCLRLNIYTPVDPEQSNINDALPVIVFITGGEWREDTAERYDPSLFMKSKKVILVTFNYRLAALGFLSTGDEIVPGNNGLKDQNMALQWIQQNILAFGGNPRKVTIYGSSAGAASVRYYMLSPMSKGLFIGGIAHGGNELDTWTLQSSSDAVKLFNKYASALNCSSWDNEKTINCLSNLDVKDLIEAEANGLTSLRVMNSLTVFKPVVEVPSKHSFLCKNPVEMLEAGEGNDVPLMIGLSENEGAYRYTELWNLKRIDELFENLDWLLPQSSASFRICSGKKAEIMDRVREYYFPKNIEFTEEMKMNSLIKYISDSWFLQGHNDLLKYHVNNYKAPVYQYVLSYYSNLSFTQWQGHPANFGASHYDEQLYLYPSEIYFPGKVLNADIHAMSETMLNFWINFAIYQDPTPYPSDAEWSTVSAPGYDYLDIMGPNELVMKQNFHYDRAEFWRNLAFEFKTDKKSCKACN